MINILERFENPLVNEFIRYAMIINDIDVKNEILFKNIYILFAAITSNDLVPCFRYLGIPLSFYPYMMITREIKKIN